MRRFLSRKPSASLVVAAVALVVALSGTAIAATGRVSGDTLIKKGSLSGNRLRNSTVTGRQIDLAKLGTVPSAANAGELGGKSPSAYALSNLLGSGRAAATNSGVDDSACYLGEVRLLAGNQVPANWHPADGAMLSISANVALYSLLGTTYGGNGTSTFALPNLEAADPRGGSPAGVDYYICTTGTFP